MRILTLVSLIALASSVAPIASANDPAPPPAAPAPAASPGSEDGLSSQLASARHDVLVAERELREANAAIARASHRDVSPSKLERLAERQERAQRAFDAARERVPGLVAQARAAGMSASTLRAYERSLRGE